MRKGRAVLQVNTFPFLAVLLCAMGSLIFLLLVIDRRAKVVARAKAMERAQQQADGLDAKRKEEWERQRQSLHALLASQHHALQGQLQAVRKQASDVSRNLQDKHARLHNIEHALSGGKLDLDRLRSGLAERRAALSQTSREEEAAALWKGRQIRQLARELGELETTLQALKAIRRRQEHMFSLVPYHGRRGESRKPIYVECTRAGLVFHPDPEAIPEPDICLSRIEAQVAKRGGDVYLLFLVRPEGIVAYIMAQNALQDSKIDYGYELVEADWSFDFSSEERLASLPWRTTRPDAGLVSERQNTAPASPPSTATSWSANRGQGRAGSGPVSAPPVAGPAQGNGRDLAGSSPLAGRLTGSPRSGGGPQICVPGWGTPLPDISASKTSTYDRQQGGVPQFSVWVPPPRFAGGEACEVGNSAINSKFINKGVQGGTSDQTVQAPASVSSGPWRAGSVSDRRRPQPNADAGNANPPEPVEQGEGVRLVGPASPLASLEKPVPPKPAVPVSRVIGNRDYPIVLECTADAVLIQPWGIRFEVDTLPPRPDPQHPLVQAMSKLIARRQATVRPGEPPFRPVVRLQVRPDGLRAYFLAYPLVETLRLPMTRENLGE